MIIGFVGFHNSGKSCLCRYIERRFSCRWVLKRALLKEWSGIGENELAWTNWYRNLYRTIGGYEIMHHLLRRIKYVQNKNSVILIDAIHTPGEWRAVKEVDSDSLLAGVFIPKESRLERSTPEDIILDDKRERYWHSKEGNHCLLSQIEWSFCGIASQELQALEVEALFEHLTKVGKIK